MKIGIIGQGFVGNAIYQKFSKYYDVKTYDIKGRIHCNSDEHETMNNEIVFVCLPTPMNEDNTCHIDIVEDAIFHYEDVKHEALPHQFLLPDWNDDHDKKEQLMAA